MRTCSNRRFITSPLPTKHLARDRRRIMRLHLAAFGISMLFASITMAPFSPFNATGSVYAASPEWHTVPVPSWPGLDYPRFPAYQPGGIQLLSDNSGWAVTSNRLLRLSGGNWSWHTFKPAGAVTAIRALAENDVWLATREYFCQSGTCSATNRLYHYDGANWTQDITMSNSVTIWDIDGVLGSDLWACGEGGSIFHYVGAGWQQVSSPTTRTLFSIKLTSQSDGWIGGAGTILRLVSSNWTTHLHEATYQPNLYPGSEYLEITQTPDGDLFMLKGFNQIIYFDGTDWVNFPSPTTHQVSDYAMLSFTEGWATDEDGLWHLANGTWSHEIAPEWNICGGDSWGASIAMSDSTHGWATGDCASFLRYSDSGMYFLAGIRINIRHKVVFPRIGYY